LWGKKKWTSDTPDGHGGTDKKKKTGTLLGALVAEKGN